MTNKLSLADTDIELNSFQLCTDSTDLAGLCTNDLSMDPNFIEFGHKTKSKQTFWPHFLCTYITIISG